MIGAGRVVTCDAPAGSATRGNPARSTALAGENDNGVSDRYLLLIGVSPLIGNAVDLRLGARIGS